MDDHDKVQGSGVHVQGANKQEIEAIFTTDAQPW